MLRRWFVVVATLCLAPPAMSSSSPAEAPAAGTGRYIVVVRGSASVSDLAGTAARLGASVQRVFDSLDTLVVSLPGARLAALERDPRVAFVTADRPVRLLDTGNRTRGVPTGVDRIGAAPPTNPDGTVGATNGPPKHTAVAVVDTGIAKRADLNVAGGYDCSGAGNFSDGNGHGTHVAGIVADKGIPGVIGVSPGTPLYAVRVMDADGSGSLSDVVCGLNWVADHASADNIKVANVSLGDRGSDDGDCGAKNNDAVHAAVCRLTAAGVTVVAAAGNDAENMSRSIPASYDEVLSVTAMADFDGKPGGLAQPTCQDGGQDDSAADFSDYATPGSADADHTIAAPGVCITSTWNDGGTETISGTSMASPHVAGLVARCIDAGPCADLSPSQIVAKLRADAAARPADAGFLGDSHDPIPGRYYGDLAWDRGY